MSYTQLTQVERCQIQALSGGNYTITGIAAKRSGALLSLTERTSLGVLPATPPSCSAEEVINATLGLLYEMKDRVLTITADNGKEFSGHEEIAQVPRPEIALIPETGTCEFSVLRPIAWYELIAARGECNGVDADWSESLCAPTLPHAYAIDLIRAGFVPSKC